MATDAEKAAAEKLLQEEAAAKRTADELAAAANATAAATWPNGGKANPAMGQGPSTGENHMLEYAAFTRKGSHPRMEDAMSNVAHAVILDLDAGDSESDSGSTSFFGVYDGHGGADVALYCVKRFHTELVEDGYYKNNPDLAIRRTFSRMDEELLQNDEWRALANPPRGFPCFPSSAPCVQGIPHMEGSTACVVLIRGNQIIVGNVGDSRCVLSRNRLAIDMSIDHTPNLPDEFKRIVDADGELTETQLGNFLISGRLAMSREIGHFEFKSNENLLPSAQIVTSTPDISIEDITHDTEFIIIASQEFWKSGSSSAAANYVRMHLNTFSLSTTCSRLLNRIKDPEEDLTLILVLFKDSAKLPPPPLLLPAPAAAAAPMPNPTGSAVSSSTDAGAAWQGHHLSRRSRKSEPSCLLRQI